MEDTVPLYEAIRSRGNRDEAGEKGEKLHQLADILEAQKNQAMVMRNATYFNQARALRGISLELHFYFKLMPGHKTLRTTERNQAGTTVPAFSFF